MFIFNSFSGRSLCFLVRGWELKEKEKEKERKKQKQRQRDTHREKRDIERQRVSSPTDQ